MEETQELKIQVKINADTKQLEIVNSQIGKFGGVVDGATKKTDLLNKTQGINKRGLMQVGNALGVNMMAFTSTATAAILFAKVLKDSVDNEQKEIQRQRTLKTTLDALNIGYDENKTAIEDTLKSLTNHTKFLSDEAYDVFNKAVTSQGNLAGGYKLVKIAMDEASRTGKPLNEVMDTLTGALAGGQRATKALRDEFGVLVGSGKTAADMITNAGAALDGTAKNEKDLGTETRGLRQSYDDITKVIGAGLMPVILGLVTVIKAVLVPVLAIVTYVVTGIKVLIDDVVGGMKVLTAFLKSGFKGVAAEQEKLSKVISKEWTDANKFIGDSVETLFGTMKTGSKDAGNAVLKNVMPPLDKIGKKTEDTADEAQKSFENIATGLQSTLGAELDKTFQKFVEDGQITQESLGTAFTGIYQAWRDMLIKMVAELLAREAIIGFLTLLSGGGVGFAASMLKGMISAPASGAMDTGGTAAKDGMYFLRKGEKATMPGGGGAGGGDGKVININLGVHAFDLRQVSKNQTDRLMRQIIPYIKREMK